MTHHRPWVMRMRWTDLLFAHWPVALETIRALVPAELEVDTFDGQAWLGIVPFRMSDVGPRGLPARLFGGPFPEVNVRTYVRHGRLAGVWFLSLDAASRLAVEGGRAGFGLPYFRARMSMRRMGEAIDYQSERIDRRGPMAVLDVRYRPTGPVGFAGEGTLDAWLTDRWRLFTVDEGGAVRRTEIRHRPWPLQPAEAEFRAESLAASHGLAVPDLAPRLLFASRVDVRGWWPRRA
jgi:uncharacterized protein